MANKLHHWSIADIAEVIDKRISNEFDYVIIVEGSTGIGKTLDFKTNLVQHDGQTIVHSTRYLGTYKDGEWINTVSWDFENNQVVFSKSQVIVEKEPKELFEVKLSNGNIINCSKDHKLFVQREDKIIELRLKDIKKGDELVCLT